MDAPSTFLNQDNYRIYAELDAIATASANGAKESTLLTVSDNVINLDERTTPGSAKVSVYKDAVDDVSYFKKLNDQNTAPKLIEVELNGATPALLRTAINAFFVATPTARLIEKVIIYNGATYDCFITYSIL